jgi:hypothetical protein
MSKLIFKNHFTRKQMKNNVTFIHENHVRYKTPNLQKIEQDWYESGLHAVKK